MFELINERMETVWMSMTGSSKCKCEQNEIYFLRLNVSLRGWWYSKASAFHWHSNRNYDTSALNYVCQLFRQWCSHLLILKKLSCFHNQLVIFFRILFYPFRTLFKLKLIIKKYYLHFILQYKIIYFFQQQNRASVCTATV